MLFAVNENQEVNMLKTPVFKGSCTAIVTPFSESGIDYERFRQALDFQYENGTAAVVVCGTTGENATLTHDEHLNLVRIAVQSCAGRMKVIVGVGSNNTLTALHNAEKRLLVRVLMCGDTSLKPSGSHRL